MLFESVTLPQLFVEAAYRYYVEHISDVVQRKSQMVLTLVALSILETGKYAVRSFWGSKSVLAIRVPICLRAK